MGTQLTQKQMRGGSSFSHLQHQLEDIKTRTGFFRGNFDTEASLSSLTANVDDQAFIRNTNRWMRYDGTSWVAISSAGGGAGSTGGTGTLSPDIMQRLVRLEDAATDYFQVFDEYFDNANYIDDKASDIILDAGRIRGGTRAIFEDSFESNSYMDTNQSAGVVIDNGKLTVTPSGTVSGQFVSSTLPIPSTRTVNFNAGVVDNTAYVFRNLTDISNGTVFADVAATKICVDKTNRLWEVIGTKTAVHYRVRTANGVAFSGQFPLHANMSVSQYPLDIVVDYDNKVWIGYRNVGTFYVSVIAPDGTVESTFNILAGSISSTNNSYSGGISMAVSSDNIVWVFYGTGSGKYLAGMKSDGTYAHPITQMTTWGGTSSNILNTFMNYNESQHSLEMFMITNTKSNTGYATFDISKRQLSAVTNIQLSTTGSENFQATSVTFRGGYIYVALRTVPSNTPFLEIYKIDQASKSIVASQSTSITTVLGSGSATSSIWEGNRLYVGYQSTASYNQPRLAILDENLNMLVDAQPIVDTPAATNYALSLYRNPFTNDLRAQVVVGTQYSEVDFSPETSKVSFEISPDGGATWQTAISGGDINFSKPSTDIRVKVKLNTLNASNRISSDVLWYRIRDVNNNVAGFTSKYVSNTIIKGTPIYHATIREDAVLNNGTIQWELSNDNGVTWEPVLVGQRHLFSGVGTGSLKVRATLFTPANEIYGPVVDGYTIVAGRAVLRQDIDDIRANLLRTNFKLAALTNATRYSMKDMVVDTFSDASGIDAKSTIVHDPKSGFVGATGLKSPDIATPAMTSATTPSGIVTASAFRAGYDPFLAFDRSPSSNHWYTYGTTLGSGHWIQYEFPSPKRIERVGIQSARISNDNDSIKDFQIQGSNDGVNYETLYVDVAQRVSTMQYYEFINRKAYKMYRLFISTSYHGTYVGVKEWEMYETSLSNTDTFLYTTVEKVLIEPTYILLAAEIEGDSSELTFEVSRDGGANWVQIQPEIEQALHGLPSGTELVVRVTFAPQSESSLMGLSYSWR